MTEDITPPPALTSGQIEEARTALLNFKAQGFTFQKVIGIMVNQSGQSYQWCKAQLEFAEAIIEMQLDRDPIGGPTKATMQ